MLLIQTSFTDIPQQITNRDTDQFFQEHIYKIEEKQHITGKVNFFEPHINAPDDQQYSHRIGLYNIRKFQSASLHPFRCIQIKCIIQDQINRYDSNQRCHIPFKR